MEICALASGSSGNCFYAGNGNSGILIDAGISCKRVEERMNSIGRKIENIMGVFVTHEHSDHIRGIDVFARKFNVPVFATKNLIKNNFLCSNDNLINEMKIGENIMMGGMEISSFSKVHKAIDPVGFSILDKRSNKKASIITDAGHACKNIIDNISDADALFLESNHDPDMLENGPYPYFLKKWIGSDNGHLSNMQAALCVLENAKKRMKNLVLCHLSEHNNTSKLAMNTHKTLLRHRFDLKPNIYVSEKSTPSVIIKL
jgi:phosphoribosyl 1,2-cyclic phosphodiesterase